MDGWLERGGKRRKLSWKGGARRVWIYNKSYPVSTFLSSFICSGSGYV